VPDCRRGHPLSPAALELLSWILGGQLTRALQMPASATTGEVASLATHRSNVTSKGTCAPFIS